MKNKNGEDDVNWGRRVGGGGLSKFRIHIGHTQFPKYNTFQKCN